MMKYKNWRIPMNLQFFAEGDGDGDDGNVADREDGKKGGNQPLSFADFLKVAKIQKIFNHKKYRPPNR